MDGDYGLGDLRFEGYDNAALAAQVDGLRNGAGSESLHDAARALVTLAGGLAETDRVLREQLRQIGVSWQGQASEGGRQATQTAAVYADDAAQPVGESAKGVATQSGEFSHTRNSAPDSATLRGPGQLNGFDRFAGMFGHTTDHAKAVQATSAARDQAVAGLNGYQAGSQNALGQARALPVPPGMDLVTRPADVGTPVGPVGGLNPGPGAAPAVPGGPGAGLGAPPLTGSAPGIPAPGQPGQPGLPGQPTSGGPGGPGGRSGIGPMLPLASGLPVTGTPAVPRGVPSLFAADAAAIAGAGAQGAAVGAAAEKDRLVRGRPGEGGAIAEEGRAKVPPKGATPLGAAPAEEAREVRNAERYGARPAKPAANSILQPATGSARDEPDAEHVRKYGVESGDLFEDRRMTAPESIGDEDEIDVRAD
jgi:hypothetical protein